MKIGAAKCLGENKTKKKRKQKATYFVIIHHYSEAEKNGDISVSEELSSQVCLVTNQMAS